jgi:hypothetical protein
MTKIPLPTTNVKRLPTQNGHLFRLAKEMKELVYSYDDRIFLAEAIGVLEIVKAEIIKEHSDD